MRNGARGEADDRAGFVGARVAAPSARGGAGAGEKRTAPENPDPSSLAERRDSPMRRRLRDTCSLFAILFVSALTTTAAAQDCAEVRALLGRGATPEQVSARTGLSLEQIERCRGLPQPQRAAPPQPAPHGAPGPPPHGAAGPSP